MTYDAMELSVEDAIRVEIYTIITPTTTYTLTDYDEDVTFDSVIYSATPISRGPAPLVPIDKVRELTITIALDHSLAQDLRLNGIPPQNTTVTIYRYHVGDAESRLIWQGHVNGLSTDDQYARLRIPNRIDEAFDCQVPLVSAGRSCPHILFDVGCGITAAAHKIAPTVSTISGTALVVSSIGGKPDNWARYGRVVRVTDGESRSVVAQIGTAITLDYPFRALAATDALEVYAGCDHTVDGADGCVPKFSNVLNFGGDPHIPTRNPAAPTGFGVALGL